ncbi:hypothetical protein ONZ51_g10685 [Trametes cubensis]|uniref:Retrotransposon Copia-like N-terminal domain-containing protein n=1 Tax=Trametes cubensis TaxID=1111947 RepID=A0AAD7TJ18_9APHY|nr:hypothetical protein ONZ51_g10685 [Trametes cubensis]
MTKSPLTTHAAAVADALDSQIGTSASANDVTFTDPDMAIPLPHADVPPTGLGISPSLASSVPAPDPDPIVRYTIPSNLLVKFSESDLLDLTHGNYRRWHRQVLDILSIAGDLACYLDKSYVCPPRLTRPQDARLWETNDRHVRSFIRLQCSEDELEHLSMESSDTPLTAATLWSFLQNRHLNRGPHAQVLLLHDVLRLRFDHTLPLVPQTHDAIRLCRQIVRMGPLTADSLSKVALLHMMRDILPNLQRSIADGLANATASAPYHVADIIKRLEIEDDFRKEERPSTSSAPLQA